MTEYPTGYPYEDRKRKIRKKITGIRKRKAAAGSLREPAVMMRRIVPAEYVSRTHESNTRSKNKYTLPAGGKK